MATALTNPRTRRLFAVGMALAVVAVMLLVPATRSSANVSTPADAFTRAQTWLNKGIPYSQSTCYPSGTSTPCTAPNYRTDCSGYVSMALGLSSSLTTGQMGNSSFATPITKDQLQPGDIMLNTGAGDAGHVVLFESWANSDHSRYNGYEFWGGGVSHWSIPYPYFSGTTLYPYHVLVYGSGGTTPPPPPPTNTKYWVTTFAAAPGFPAPGSGSQSGTLNAGYNYTFCKVWGPIKQVGSYYNHWWLKTDLDTGSNWQNQYVSAYYLANWGNDQALTDSGGTIPNC